MEEIVSGSGLVYESLNLPPRLTEIIIYEPVSGCLQRDQPVVKQLSKMVIFIRIVNYEWREN